MKLYTIRPYFGHDCNSWDGFNSGYYLESISVHAENESDAIGKAMIEFRLENPEFNKFRDDSHFGDDNLYLESNHDTIFDESGDEIESQYTYQYVSFAIDSIEETGS